MNLDLELDQLIAGYVRDVAPNPPFYLEEGYRAYDSRIDIVLVQASSEKDALEASRSMLFLGFVGLLPDLSLKYEGIRERVIDVVSSIVHRDMCTVDQLLLARRWFMVFKNIGVKGDVARSILLNHLHDPKTSLPIFKRMSFIRGIKSKEEMIEKFSEYNP
jgi:hypothetical protein